MIILLDICQIHLLTHVFFFHPSALFVRLYCVQRNRPLAGSTVGATTQSAGTGGRGEPMIVNYDLGGGM